MEWGSYRITYIFINNTQFLAFLFLQVINQRLLSAISLFLRGALGYLPVGGGSAGLNPQCWSALFSGEGSVDLSSFEYRSRAGAAGIFWLLGFCLKQQQKLDDKTWAEVLSISKGIFFWCGLVSSS